jgi:hypothetical protein
MPRSDGRLETGQKLNRSISARAWNRAQEAADLVLGQRDSFTVPDTQGRYHLLRTGEHWYVVAAECP